MRVLEFDTSLGNAAVCPNGCGQAIFRLEATIPTRWQRSRIVARCITCMELFHVANACPSTIDPPDCAFFEEAQ